ncbi:MAG: NYN domain-containing protein [Betaproteobacteria bacterium]|nr:MAG: NYN domain-containing protein [Betaproteobacteria bacterium]
MPASPEARSLAVFCDFENVALGVREAKYAQFDMDKVLERLLLKGSIVVKKAYCDWERYKEFKPAMHAASFEMIEIPHLRQSGKNSADIRMVVDALDLCYTKEHVDTFVIVSGDSDFSPLVSKLRENAKTVIGVGVKNSSSDLLINNCDEFIYYDDLVRQDEQKQEKIWGSMVKQALKRRKPGFNESYYGFRAFSDLLEEMQQKALIKLDPDEKSGGYLIRPA